MIDMNEKEMIDKLIDEYVNLQRIYNTPYLTERLV